MWTRLFMQPSCRTRQYRGQPGHSLTSSFHNINLSTKITVAVEIDWLLVGDEMAMDDMA